MSEVKSVFLLLAILLGTASLAADRPTPFQLIMVTSEHCPFCMAWEREVGSTYPRTGYAEQAALQRIDFQNLDSALPDLHPKVRGTPTFLIMDAGTEIGRITGYQSKDMFYWALSEYITP